MFEQIKAFVLSKLSLKSFSKVNGREVLTEEHRKALVGLYDEKFVAEFEKDLEASQVNSGSDPVAVRLEARIAEYEKRLDASEKAAQNAVKAADAAKAENVSLKKQVEELADKGEPDPAFEIVKSEKGNVVKFKPNMSYAHNKVAKEFLEGNQSALIMAGDTIEQNVLEEFGELVNAVKLPMIKDVITGFETAQVLNWKRAIKSWKATTAEITRVIQQFTAEWTPLGKSKFTPLEIPMFRFKINLPIKPAEIEGWIYEMYDESKDLDQMPLTLYIINELMVPKAKEDLEEICAIAEFVELDESAISEGDAGQDPMNAMDGFVTTLKKEKAKATTAVNFLLDGVVLTSANIVEKMQEFADAIAPKYRKKQMPIYADPDLVLMYQRAYTTKYPLTKNADGTVTRVDHTRLNLVPLNSMIGTGAFFATPAENFIGLRHKNEPGESRLFMQKLNYTLKIFAEFWFGVGFAIAEAVFAYIPDEEGSGSGSGS